MGYTGVYMGYTGVYIGCTGVYNIGCTGVYIGYTGVHRIHTSLYHHLKYMSVYVLQGWPKSRVRSEINLPLRRDICYRELK